MQPVYVATGNEISTSKKAAGKHSEGQTTLGTERLEAFSDGVFTIIITPLFYNPKVPEIGNREDWRRLLDRLLQFAPKFGGTFSALFSSPLFGCRIINFSHAVKRRRAKCSC